MSLLFFLNVIKKETIISETQQKNANSSLMFQWKFSLSFSAHSTVFLICVIGKMICIFWYALEVFTVSARQLITSWCSIWQMISLALLLKKSLPQKILEKPGENEKDNDVVYFVTFLDLTSGRGCRHFTKEKRNRKTKKTLIIFSVLNLSISSFLSIPQVTEFVVKCTIYFYHRCFFY